MKDTPEINCSIDDFFKDVVCVMVDEAHRVAGNVLQTLLSGPAANIPIRWGLTGTMPKEAINSVALTSYIGPLVGSIKATELQDKGILANLHINIWQLQDLPPTSYRVYADEYKWLCNDKMRLKYVANQIKKIANDGNTLVLVGRLKTGEILNSLIEDSVFLSGGDKSSERIIEYKEMQEIDNKILICTSGIASTGIDISRVFNLVLFELGKSYIKTIQSIGRGLRVAKDKSFVNVYDICSNLKYSKRHLTERKKAYKEAEYPFSITKIN